MSEFWKSENLFIFEIGAPSVNLSRNGKGGEEIENKIGTIIIGCMCNWITYFWQIVSKRIVDINFVIILVFE